MSVATSDELRGGSYGGGVEGATPNNEARSPRHTPNPRFGKEAGGDSTLLPFWGESQRRPDSSPPEPVARLMRKRQHAGEARGRLAASSASH